MPVGQTVGDDPCRHGDDQQDRNCVRKRALQHLGKFQSVRVYTVVDASWVPGKNCDVKPEIIETLIPRQPDAGRRHRDHQAVEKGNSNYNERQIRHDLHSVNRLSDLDQRVTQQAQCEQRLIDHRQLNFLARDQKLRVDRLDQSKIKITRAYHLAEVCTIRHEQRFNDRVDQHARRHEGEILRASPVINRVDVAVNYFEQRNLSTEPERSRDHVDEKITAKHHLPDESVSKKRRPDSNVVCLS